MPKIEVTSKDLARLHPPDAGTYLFELVSVEESASKDKQSINYACEMKVLSPGANLRIAYFRFNSKAPGMLIPLAAALQDIPIDKIEAGTIDTDVLLGKKCWAEVKDRTWEGKIQKDLDNFAPENSKPPFN